MKFTVMGRNERDENVSFTVDTPRVGESWKLHDGRTVQISDIDFDGDFWINDWEYHHPSAFVERVTRAYIAGPMSGLPELNFPAFQAAARKYRDRGCHVENPAEINPDPAMKWEDALRADIPRLLTCDTIVMLDGWTASRGAQLEHHIAKSLGMTIVYEVEA